MFKHLSASELLNEHGDYPKLKPVSGKDLKLVISTKDAEEESKIEKYILEKYRFLKAKRVEKVARLSIAEWLPEENVAHVNHQVSKIWQTVGTKIGNKLIIDPFEIMYLMESNQLELLCNNVSISIEEARVLISNGQTDFIGQYRVHAQLRRYGYTVLKHDPKRNQINEPSPKKKESINNTIDLKNNSNDNYFEKQFRDTSITEIKESFDQKTHNRDNNNLIKEAVTTDDKAHSVQQISDDNLKGKKVSKWGQYKQNLRTELKRKQCENIVSDKYISSTKKVKYINAIEENIPVLRHKQTYLNLDEVYKAIQLCRGPTKTCEEYHDFSKINFALDLYKPNSRFKKTTIISPNYRVIILNSSDDMMPCERCLKRKQELLKDNVPIILARVGFDNISYFLFSSLDTTLHS